MGWAGYGIYDGDGTQTCHYTFIKWSKCATESDVFDEEWLTYRKTKIPKNKIANFKRNIKNVVVKMPKIKKFWDEYKAIEWQMLLALLLDNEIKPPSIIKRNGILASEFLMGEHASEFDKPAIRRRVLRNFIKRAKSK